MYFLTQFNISDKYSRFANCAQEPFGSLNLLNLLIWSKGLTVYFPKEKHAQTKIWHYLNTDATFRGVLSFAVDVRTFSFLTFPFEKFHTKIFCIFFFCLASNANALVFHTRKADRIQSYFIDSLYSYLFNEPAI